LLSSKGEARRLIQNRGAYFNGQRILDASFVISRENFLPGGICILSVGKKKSILVRILKKG